MEIVDLAMSVAFLAAPPILFAFIRSRLRAAIYSVGLLWLLMIVGGKYHLAYTPGYDSLAPGLALLVGWFPSTVYTLIWLSVFTLIGFTRPNA